MNNYKPLVALCFGYFMVIIDVTVVNVALPKLGIGLHVNLTSLAWVVDAYTLTFAALLLTAGSLSDIFGAKIIFQIGLVIFILASLFCGIAPDLKILVIFRLIQGIGSALLVPTSISLINISYPDKNELSKAIGLWASVAGIAAAVGPLLGAVVTTIFNWRGIFLINLPFGLLCYYLTSKWVIVPKKIIKTKLDFGGQLLGITVIASLAYGLININNGYKFIIAASVFCFSFIFFIFYEYLHHMPMLPLNIFKSKRFNSSICVGFILNMGYYGELFLLPIYFHRRKHYSVFLSGLAISPQVALIALGSYISGKLLIKIKDKTAMLIGLLITSAGFGSLLIGLNYQLSYIFLIFPLLLIGFGTAVIMPAATLASVSSVSAKQSGLASAVLNTTRQIGSLVGVALVGGIVSMSPSLSIGIQYTLSGALVSFLCGVGLVML